MAISIVYIIWYISWVMLSYFCCYYVYVFFLSFFHCFLCFVLFLFQVPFEVPPKGFWSCFSRLFEICSQNRTNFWIIPVCYEETFGETLFLPAPRKKLHLYYVLFLNVFFVLFSVPNEQWRFLNPFLLILCCYYIIILGEKPTTILS